MSDMKLTEDQTNKQIAAHKDEIHLKLKQQTEVEDVKKDTAASYRSLLKEIKEEIQAELESIEELESHLKVLAGSQLLAVGNV